MITVTAVGHQPRNRKLALLPVALLALGMASGGLVPLTAEAGAGKALKLCRNDCKGQAQACVNTFQDEFQAEKEECKAKERKKERKQCKKAAKGKFKLNKRHCTTAYKKACMPCCKATGVISGCNVVVCGDGFVRGEEQCEDGNALDADGCSATCLLECGNGIIEAGEQCESDGDCAATERCVRCACGPQCESDEDCPTSHACVDSACTPPLGRRTFSLGPDSVFKSTLLGERPLASPTGRIELEASAPDENGVVTVATVDGPFVVRFDVKEFASLTVCNKIHSCTGKLYCDGNANVDVLVELNSVGESEPMCIRDGTNNCPDDPGSLCCANACEGAGVGSGNIPVNSVGINPEVDSGPGALVLTCDQQSEPFELGAECPAELTTALLRTVYTTGRSTARVINHCAGTGASPSITPEFFEDGVNFNCATWRTEDSKGAVAFSIPTEEPTIYVTGDGANAGVFAD